MTGMEELCAWCGNRYGLHGASIASASCPIAGATGVKYSSTMFFASYGTIHLGEVPVGRRVEMYAANSALTDFSLVPTEFLIQGVLCHTASGLRTIGWTDTDRPCSGFGLEDNTYTPIKWTYTLSKDTLIHRVIPTVFPCQVLCIDDTNRSYQWLKKGNIYTATKMNADDDMYILEKDDLPGSLTIPQHFAKRFIELPSNTQSQIVAPTPAPVVMVAPVVKPFDFDAYNRTLPGKI